MMLTDAAMTMYRDPMMMATVTSSPPFVVPPIVASTVVGPTTGGPVLSTHLPPPPPPQPSSTPPSSPLRFGGVQSIDGDAKPMDTAAANVTALTHTKKEEEQEESSEGQPLSGCKPLLREEEEEEEQEDNVVRAPSPPSSSAPSGGAEPDVPQTQTASSSSVVDDFLDNLVCRHQELIESLLIDRVAATTNRALPVQTLVDACRRTFDGLLNRNGFDGASWGVSHAAAAALLIEKVLLVATSRGEEGEGESLVWSSDGVVSLVARTL